MPPLAATFDTFGVRSLIRNGYKTALLPSDFAESLTACELMVQSRSPKRFLSPGRL